MKIIVAGSRTITDYNTVAIAINEGLRKFFDGAILNWHNIEIVSGMALGVDTVAIQYARNHNLRVIGMPANWKAEGKAAGYKRNERMALCSDALVAVWDGKSKGTQHMINLAFKHNLQVYVKRIDDESSTLQTTKI